LVVFSEHPGTIKEVIDIDLGNKRYKHEIRMKEEFISLKQRIWGMIQS